MTFDEYQIAARRTQNPALTYEEKRNHALFGLCSEVGEVLGLYQKVYQGHGLDKEKVQDEISDCFWMLAELCDSNCIRMDDVAQHNIHKLEKRYKDGFTVEESVNRVEYRGKQKEAAKAPETAPRAKQPLEKVLLLFAPNEEIIIHPFGQDEGFPIKAGMAASVVSEKLMQTPVTVLSMNEEYAAIEIWLEGQP